MITQTKKVVYKNGDPYFRTKAGLLDVVVTPTPSTDPYQFSTTDGKEVWTIFVALAILKAKPLPFGLSHF